MDINTLQKKHAEVLERMNALAEAAKKENRGLNDDEISEFDGCETEIEGLKRSMERAEKLARINEERAVPTSKPVDIKVIREEGEDEKGECKVWRSFGEQLQAVVSAGKNPHRTDARLAKSDLLMRAATGASEGVNADGGFLVQNDFAQEILRRATETGILSSRVRRLSISQNSNSIKIPAVDETSRVDGSRWGGIQAFWEGEADEYQGSKPKFRQMELVLKKLTGLCYATDEVLADASVLQTVISEGFSEEFGFKLDDAIIRGSGTGEPLGLLNSGALVTVAKETAQAADTLKLENIVKMRSRLHNRSRPNAIWVYNQDIEPQLHTMTYGGNAAPVYMPAGNIAGQPFDTLYGLPAFAIEHCATLGDKGDIMLVDPTQYLMVDKGSLQRAVSVHVRFIHDEQVFKFTYRCDARPVWSAPLTPYKGAASTSPFVTLAERA